MSRSPRSDKAAAGRTDWARVGAFSEADIERTLQRSFPVERKLLEVFDVTLAAPMVHLLPERNRLSAVFDLQARDRLMGGSWRARLSLTSALRWDAGEQTLRLTQVRVDDLSLVDPGAAARSAVERLGAALAERVLEDTAVYRLPPEKAEQLRKLGVEPGAVTVTSRGVEIGLTPQPH